MKRPPRPSARTSSDIHVDTDRLSRQGFPEVVLCESKTDAQVAEVMRHLVKAHGRALGTRLAADRAPGLLKAVPGSRYDAVGRLLVAGPLPVAPDRPIAVVACAGTSDLPVAAEAAGTLAFLGHKVVAVNDIGVAGLHRMLAAKETLASADIIIVVAGMEGALPSVIGGMVACPVVAVPTSVGYGASFGGVAALLGMLNSCASGLTVVNIDNGFGAAMAAHRVLARLGPPPPLRAEAAGTVRRKRGQA